MSKLLTADLINKPKFLHARMGHNYLGIRVGRFKLSFYRRWRGGFSAKHVRGHYFNLDIGSRTKHAWWALMVYFFYNEDWRSR